MSKLIIDFINPPSKGEPIFGIRRVFFELSKTLGPYIDRKDVYYKSLPSKLLHWPTFSTNRFLYSLQKLQHRKKSVKQIWSQEEAYILNYITLSKVAVMCYDLIPYIFPHHLNRKLAISFALKGMLKADRIMVSSVFTKNEIIKYLAYPEERIVVVSCGVDTNTFRPLQRDKNFITKYNLMNDTKRIIFVGNNDPRRGLSRLVDAFYRVKQKFKNVKLFIAGEDVSWMFPPLIQQEMDLQNKLRQLSLQKDVFLFGYVKEKELIQLYNEADVFVYPSSYEGFGIPPLEAMACGVPVITSNLSSLPEVVGNAGILVDPTNTEGLANKMLELLTNDNLREELRKKGLKRVKSFTWDRVAERVLKVYKELAMGET